MNQLQKKGIFNDQANIQLFQELKEKYCFFSDNIQTDIKKSKEENSANKIKYKLPDKQCIELNEG